MVNDKDKMVGERGHLQKTRQKDVGRGKMEKI